MENKNKANYLLKMSDDGYDKIHQQDWQNGKDCTGNPCYEWSESDVEREHNAPVYDDDSREYYFCDVIKQP